MRPAARALFTLLLSALAAGSVAQTTPTASAPACPAAADLTPTDLYGLWHLVLWPEGGSESAPVSTGVLLFGPHPEYPGSVRGRLRRSGPGADLEAEVAGDVGDDGEFSLDESADGVTMDAVWTGQPGECGRTVRGLRQLASSGRSASTPALQFLLRRISSDR
jgi:hypothetical protein